MTEDPPKTLRPRENVLPRLCDTNANLLRPITHADNQAFAQRLATWGGSSKHLRIWDYAVTYTPYYGLPLPTVHTYPIDYRYFAEHNVEGVFTEHEYAVLADLRDLKIWMMIKLWSWIIQFPVDSAVDPRQPEQKFDVWARIKFEGPGFPHSQPGQKNAICIERVVLVQY
jgi:hypothetical protein